MRMLVCPFDVCIQQSQVYCIQICLGKSIRMKRVNISPTPGKVLGCVAQSVTCLTAYTCLTADPGVASLITDQSNTFVEIDHKIISTAILLPSSGSRRVVVSYKRSTG